MSKNIAAVATVVTVANVKRIGAGERLTKEVAAAIVAAVPVEYDWTARGAVPQAIIAAIPGGADETQKRAVYVTEQATGKRVTLKRGATFVDGSTDTIVANGDGAIVQESTDFGRGVDALRKAVSALVKDDDTPKPVALRVTLSGEGGGSTVIPTDHPLYSTLVDLIRGESA